ncbi:MAG: C40 family peptidase [Solirubrobacterales bacterium]|nr:C40 family peptidase [Solirubrobacterales bacterium]
MSIARRAVSYAFLCSSLAVFATALVAAMPGARAWASSAPGGISSREYEPEVPAEVPTETAPVGVPGKATLVNGRAIPPAGAPAAVRKVIAAANKIRAKPYIWGGGHGRWWDAGYDCSGAVSFALHGGRLLETPMPSGPMESWGLPGAGHWITVYANAGHAYAVIAGLRWDTAGDTSGTGPRWHEGTAAAAAGRFIARHPEGY